MGGWLEDLELKQAIQFSFGLGLCKNTVNSGQLDTLGVLRLIYWFIGLFDDEDDFFFGGGVLIRSVFYFLRLWLLDKNFQ